MPITTELRTRIGGLRGPGFTDADMTEVMNQVLAGAGLTFYTTLAAAHAAEEVDSDFILSTGFSGFQRRKRTAEGSDVLFTYTPPAMGYFPYEVGGNPVSVPYSLPVTDLYAIIASQSNGLAAGGNSALSPDTDQWEILPDGSVIPLDDPMSPADPGTGSPWPAFANMMYERYGRYSAFLQLAQGGTSILAESNPAANWSPTGALRQSAVDAIRICIDALSENPNFILGNVIGLSVIGEQDAQQLHLGTPGVSAAAFTSGMVEFAEFMKESVPLLSTIWMWRLGARNNRAEGAAWGAIREAQENAAAASSLLRVVYRGATSFPEDASDVMFDQLHHAQTALNIEGAAGAIEGGKVTPTAIPGPPVILAKQSFIDTNVATALTGTGSHTTADGTKLLVVPVCGLRYSSGSGSNTTSVTFDGVELAPMLDSTTTVPNGATGTTNTTAVGHARTSFWYLTEEAYGAPLSGVTADIVVTQSATSVLISFAAYDIDQDAVVDTAVVAVKIAGTEGTLYEAGYTADPAAGITTGAPCLVIAAIGSIGDSATKATHVWSGLTEDYDDGAGSGTRSGQMSTASDTFSADLTEHAITVTTSSMTGGGLAAVALRARVEGEEAL